MIARSRERNTLEALQDAVNYLASIREERKAIIAVTEGWLLYREDPDLVRQRGKMEAPLGVDKMRVGPTGKLTLEDTKNSYNALSPEICDRERVYLANIDNDKFLREIIDDANRGNSTFYMIDPGGLKASRADRSGAMRTLAENTDGLAVLNTNDLDKGLNRLADDMSSYYLLGYYAIEHQARRSLPDDHRAREAARRRGAGEEGVPRADEADELTTPPAATAAAPARDVPCRRRSTSSATDPAQRRACASTPWWARARRGRCGSWASCVRRRRVRTSSRRARGGHRGDCGLTSSSGTAMLKPGQRVFLDQAGVAGRRIGHPRCPRAADLADDAACRSRRAFGSTSTRRAEARHVPARPDDGPAVLPAADPVFSRTERVRLEIPVGAAPRDGKTGSGRLLDRGGHGDADSGGRDERTDDGLGQRWITADLSLAALSPGDYVVEVGVVKESGEDRVLMPIRVGR